MAWNLGTSIAVATLAALATVAPSVTSGRSSSRAVRCATQALRRRPSQAQRLALMCSKATPGRIVRTGDCTIDRWRVMSNRASPAIT